MKKLAIIAAAICLTPSAFANDIDAAVRAFFAKNGANGAMEFLDATAGVKRALSLPAQPDAIYRADNYHVVSYRASDAQAQPVDLDVFVSGDAGEREVSLVYVSSRAVVQDMVAKGHIAKVQ
jgi:hypothetical protein